MNESTIKRYLEIIDTISNMQKSYLDSQQYQIR